MIEFPSTTAVNRILPKDKFIEHLDLSPNLKKNLISDIIHIRILNKFSKSVLNFREDVDEVDCPKASTRGEVSRSDGGVTEFKVKHSLKEQPPSEDWIVTQSTTARNDDDGTGVSNTLLLNKVSSGSVTLSARKQATSPQGEALKRPDIAILGSSSHDESIEKPITEVLLLQIELKKHDFDPKLIEVIAKQNSHKLVFLLRFDKYAKLAVYYKQLYIGQWKPYEELNLVLRGNSVNEVWLSFVEQIALEESGVIGVGCDRDDCPKASKVEDALKLPLEGKWSALADRKGDLTRENLGLSKKTLDYSNSFTPQSAKADSSATRPHPVAHLHAAILDGSPQVEPLVKNELDFRNYTEVISKSDLDHQLDLQNKRKGLQNEITKLDSAIRRERQPNRKFELHKKLMELEESLRALRLVYDKREKR